MAGPSCSKWLFLRWQLNPIIAASSAWPLELIDALERLGGSSMRTQLARHCPLRISQDQETRELQCHLGLNQQSATQAGQVLQWIGALEPILCLLIPLCVITCVGETEARAPKPSSSK